MVEEDTGRLIGRGSTDDKGPILGWLNVLEAHRSLGIAMPVNMRFCFEGMEENGSEGLDECIQEEVRKGKDGWFDGVDCVCIVRAARDREGSRGVLMYCGSERQLLAEHPDAGVDLWAAWHRVLQH